MSGEDRSRLYAWFREHTDQPLAEYLMSCLAPAPLSDLATKSDIAALRTDVSILKSDVGKLESRFDQLFALRESDRAEATALLRESERAEATALLRESDRAEAKRQLRSIIAMFIGMTGTIVAAMFGVVAIT